MTLKSFVILLLGFVTLPAFATPFTNGGFEDGTTAGWTTGGGDRASLLNSDMTTAKFLPGGAYYDASSNRSAIIDSSYVDPNLGGLLGSTIYSGKYAYRAEDTTFGGYASVISQKVTNYTDANIFFAWKAVLQNGGHSADESAEMIIELFDNTTNSLIISRVYNAGAGGGGVDNRFSSSGDLFYTADWQVEQFTLNAGLSGHDFTLSLLAADCQPTGHTGYAYLDGFGAVAPVSDVPEPGTLWLLAPGIIWYVARRRAGTIKQFLAPQNGLQLAIN